MKKIIPIVAVVCIILLSSIIFIFQNHNDHKNKDSSVNENKDNIQVDVNLKESSKDDNNENLPNDQEEIKNDKKEEQVTNNNFNTNNDKKNNNSTNKPNSNTNKKPNNSQTNTGSNKPNNTSTSNNENNESKPVEIPKVKGVCNNSNTKWVAYLSKWKASNPTSVPFNSKSDAISYGKYAMNDFGYAYEYTSIPVAYEDEECKIEIWSTRLSVPQKSCGDNKQIWINATSKNNLIDIYDYLRKQGYDCGTKKWYK